MELWYFEQKTKLGTWSPCTGPEMPNEGVNKKSCGGTFEVRQVRTVLPKHYELTLDQLATFYGSKARLSPQSSVVPEVPVMFLRSQT